MNLSTRRRLLKTGLASAFVAASGVPVAAGQRTGGSLRLAIDTHSTPVFGLPAGCDPEFAHLATYASVFETLVEVTGNGVLRGEIAERWHGSPDATVWSIRLRDGVRFHDGTPLIAEHVVQSLEAQSGSRALQHVAGLKATDRLDLRISLSVPDTSFPFHLSRPEFAIRSNTDAAMPQGTGPYRVARYRPESRLIAERSEQAHNAGSGRFDRVEVLASSDSDQRAGMLRTGRVDALAETTPLGAPRLSSVPGLRSGWIKDARYLTFDLTRIPRQDLRQTLMDAVDARAMVEDVLKGHGRAVFTGHAELPGRVGSPLEIGIARGDGFDETAARLVSVLARTSAREGFAFRSGAGAQGTIGVGWVGPDEARMLQAGDTGDQVVILGADALGVMSERLLGPEPAGARFPLDDARIARRRWLA